MGGNLNIQKACKLKAQKEIEKFHYSATGHLNQIDTRDSNNLFVILNFKVLIFCKSVGISAEELQDKDSSRLLNPKTSPPKSFVPPSPNCLEFLESLDS